MKIALVFVAALAASAAGQSCGRRNGYSALTKLFGQGIHYVVGGSEAIPNEFPWQVSFQIFYSEKWWQPKKWLHNCGGSIIDDQWILTAAHCHVLPNIKDYRIVVGAHHLGKEESAAQAFKIARIIMHPGWDADTVRNDIMLIKLAGRINLNGRTVAPICLPGTFDVFDRTTCVTSGWGKTTHGGLESDTLLKVDLPIVPNPVCAMRYRNVEGAQILRTNICAGNLDFHGEGVCQGDSGGPLACFSNGGYKLAGITSFGVICGSADHPAVYTRVSEYRTWIDTIRSRY